MLGKKFSLAPGAALMVVAVVLIVNLAFAPNAWAASKYKTLHNFKGGEDGNQPIGGLTFDPAGNLYGTTFWGGAYNYGMVFKLSPNGDGSWTKNVLHSFNADGTDGVGPTAAVILDQSGNLYGTTTNGGAYSWGTVFQLSPNGDGSWTESVLHAFNYDGTDGFYPTAGLISDQSGNLYCTTPYGGAYSGGTVFQLTQNGDGSWTESMLHSFNPDSTEGSGPWAGLIFDHAGNLYGTATSGGKYGGGTVFQLTPNGNGSWTESVLHSFRNKDGYQPSASLIFDPVGNLYGTTNWGGAYVTGAVFNLVPNGHKGWTETVLHSFNGDRGAVPSADLILDSAGNLYGTTSEGGLYWGTAFRLQRTKKGGWKETVLHRFRNHPGAYPIAGLIFDGHGSLYGTTVGDDIKTWGSVFEITP